MTCTCDYCHGEPAVVLELGSTKAMCSGCIHARSCQRCRQLMDIESLRDDDGYVVCHYCGSRQLHVGLRLLRDDVGRRPWGLRLAPSATHPPLHGLSGGGLPRVEK